MARGKCVDQCVFTRTFRNTLPFRQSWSASVQGLAGTVSPAQFVMWPGERRTVTITINSSALPQDGSWQFGTMVLQPQALSNPNQPVLRLPVAVAVPPPTLVLMPESVSMNVPAGSNEKVNFTVKNTGGIRLDFTVDNTGTGTSTLSEAANGNYTGYRSGSYTDPATAGPGEYASDDFTVSVPTRLT